MRLKSVYNSLFKKYGAQHWWPADNPFEVMVGAILTQNTAWTNVEKALSNIKQAGPLSPYTIIKTEHEDLASWLRPSGYFNIKAIRLKSFCRWYIQHGLYDGLKRQHSLKLREMLLSVKGIGPETADDILLYAFNRKVFVIDAYTRRIFYRLGIVDESLDYETMRSLFENELHSEEIKLFNEFHALIVIHAKQICKKKPDCESCCLRSICQCKGLTV